MQVTEAQGFGHLDKDVTVPRIVVFRDAILDLMQVELGDRFNTRAMTGWKALLNYFGGGLVWTKQNFAERLFLLAESWKLATAGKDKNAQAQQKEAEEAGADAAKTNEKGSKKKKGNKHKGGDEKGDTEGKG